jgi:hypothetical protein
MTRTVCLAGIFLRTLHLYGDDCPISANSLKLRFTPGATKGRIVLSAGANVTFRQLPAGRSSEGLQP